MSIVFRRIFSLLPDDIKRIFWLIYYRRSNLLLYEKLKNLDLPELPLLQSTDMLEQVLIAENLTSKMKLISKKNKSYFLNATDYHDRAFFYRKAYGEKNICTLNPANTAFLRFLGQYLPIDFRGSVVDFGTGFGNFLGYLQELLPNATIQGIDNFSQVNKSEVHQYQNNTFGFEIRDNYKLIINVDVMCIGFLPVNYAFEFIKSFRPTLVLCESVYTLNDDTIEVKRLGYQIIHSDVCITVFELQKQNC